MQHAVRGGPSRWHTDASCSDGAPSSSFTAGPQVGTRLQDSYAENLRAGKHRTECGGVVSVKLTAEEQLRGVAAPDAPVSKTDEINDLRDDTATLKAALEAAIKAGGKEAAEAAAAATKTAVASRTERGRMRRREEKPL